MVRKSFSFISLFLFSFLTVSCTNKVNPSFNAIEEVTITSEKENNIFSKKYKLNNDIIFDAQLDDDTFLVRQADSTDKIIDGIDNVIYKYSLSSQTYEKYLETFNKDYMFKKIYCFDSTWIVWIESNYKVDEVMVTPGGRYIIGCKNIKTGEAFKVKESNKSSSLSPTVNIDPTDIQYNNHHLAFKSMDIVDNKYIETIESFDLINKSLKSHYNTNDFFETRLSNPVILNNNISYTEIPYGNFSKLSKLFYHNIDEDTQILIEENHEPYLFQPYLSENYIYIVEYKSTSTPGLSKFSISRLCLTTNIKELILSDDSISKDKEATHISSEGGVQFEIKYANDTELLISTSIGEDVYYNVEKKSYGKIIDKSMYENTVSAYISKIFKNYIITTLVDTGGTPHNYLFKLK